MITACKTEAVSREGLFPPCSLPGTGQEQTVAVFPPCSLQDTGRDQTVAVSAGESVAQSKEQSLSKARVKHDGAWSPHGWVAVTC